MWIEVNPTTSKQGQKYAKRCEPACKPTLARPAKNGPLDNYRPSVFLLRVEAGKSACANPYYRKKNCNPISTACSSLE